MEDKRKALYDALSGEYDLGSYEDFTTKLNDENKRRALYDAAGQDYNLGSYEEYSEKLGFGSEPSGIVPMFNDEPQGAPMPENVEENSRKLRGLWANFKESSKGLWAGLKGYAGEQLNLFTGSSREEQAALNDIEQLEEQGVDVMQYLADKEDAEFHKSYGMSKDQFLALDKKERKRLVRQASERMLEQQSVMSDAQLKELKRRQANQQIVEDAFNNALEIAGGDLTRAKEILREQAADKTKGDILIEEATETMNNLRQPEGFAGWVGNMLPQMVPAAASIAINYLTKGKASGLSRALGYGTMGGLTLSTAGMSMIEARNAGATNLEVWATGIADGAIEIISEKIPFDRVTKRVFSSAKANVAEKLGDAVLTPKGRKELEKLLSDANEKLGGKLFSKKNIGEWLTDTAYEAAGEFTAEALQTITTMIYENPEDYPTISEVLANGWEGAKAGLFMGSITGGASLAASHAMNKDRRQTQGYVDVAQMENENGDVEVVEVVGEDPQTGNVTILHGDSVEEVSQDKLGDRFRFSYEEFENGRLRSREDDAIDNGVVNDGQIRGMEETIQKDLNELRNFFTEDEINQIASGTIPANASAEGVAAARRYMDDVQRIDDLHAAKAEQDQKRKDACRDRIESEVGQRFWVQEEGEDNGSGIIPVTETVEEVVYSDGRVGYVVGSDEAGNLTMVYNDGSRGFSSRSEIAEKENSGEILSNTVMGLDDYLAIKVDIEDVTAETTRMEQEQTANVQSVKASHPVGSIINVGTAEAKVEVPVIATTADGVIVQMPDGTTPQLTWADVAHAEGQEVKPKTNAELDQEIVDEYRVAYQPAVKTGQEPSITEREIEVEQTTPANPLPLKADGSVDQTALWNKDPERWAQWNDEQRQDGGANSLAYVSGAIAKEQAKIAELQAAYNAEADFDKRDAIEKEIADTQERVERLTAIQQGYVAQAEAAAAPVVEAESEPTLTARMASEMSQQELNDLDESYDIILSQTKVPEEKARLLQEYLDRIAEGSTPIKVLTRDNYEDVMRAAGCPEEDIIAVGRVMKRLKPGRAIAGFVSAESIFVMADGIPSISEARVTYVHERQHVINSSKADKVREMAIALGDKANALAVLEKFVGVDGLAEYENDPLLKLADEIIARCMEIAYTTEEFSVDLQSKGLSDSVISIIEEIDNEQRNDKSLIAARRSAYAGISRRTNAAQDGRNSGQVSGGILVGEENRSAGVGGQGTGAGSTGEGAEVISEEQLNAPNSGTAQQITAADGEVLADTDGKGGVRFSIRTWNEGGRDYLAAWLANDAVLTEEEKADILARMDEVYKNALLYSDTYVPFGTWSDAEVRYDNEGNPLMSVVKANGDYAMNLDFSLVCKKRRPLNRLLRTLINRNAFGSYDLKEREIAEINWILQEHGFEVACALCFVDSKRYRVAGVADVFAKLWNNLVTSLAPNGVQIAHFNYNDNPNVEPVENGLDTLPDDQLNWTKLDKAIAKFKKGSVEYKVAQYLREHPEARKLVDATDFIEAEGFEAVKEANPDLLKFYNMKKGTGGPKASFGDVQYLNDILKSGKKFDAEKAYAVGGVRLQSFSDFVPHMYFDYMQLFAELAAKKLPVHAYTKEVLFAKIFGLAGAKINLSLVPAVVEGGIAPGLDAEGNYAWADPVVDAEGNVIQQGQTFPYDEAMAIQRAEGYSKNCGAIAVGISDAHIEKMLDDPNIPFIIPYHKSSLNAIVARMTNINQYKDYTKVQNTRKAGGSKLDKGTKDFNFNEYLHGLGESGTPQMAAQAYLDWCKENKFIPKFSQFAYHPNYYKLLQDFNTIDLTTGEYAPQGAVTMTFPTEESAFGNVETLIQQGLQEDAALEEKMEQEIDGIADQVVARLEEIAKEPKMSDKQRVKKMAELADERMAKIKEQSGVIDLVEEAKKAVAREEAKGNVSFRITPEMKEIKKQAEKDGTFMKAPNGQPTNLTEEQWLMVRTQNFKNWFGDWENDPENASKVVDENGEPKVVFHQTNQKIYVNRETGEIWDELGWKEKMEWDERDDWEDYWEEQDFNTFSRVNARTTNEFDGFFFAPEYDEYHEYGDRTIAAFVNIKNPASREDYNIDSRYNDAGRDERIRLQEAGFDGVIRMDGDNVDEYIAFEPNQIKSATDNNGDFNPNNNDIRFRTMRTDEQREQLFADAKEKFGVTNNFKVAGYMLPDGSLLDFSEANDGGDPNQRSLDHRSIEDVIMEDGTEYDSRWMYLADFMNEGAIRLLPEYAGINLMKAPTKEQRQKLFDFIYKYNGEVILEIADERLNNVAYVEYDRRTSPARIFRDIDGYFNEGIVPQQDIRFRVANNNQAIFVSNAAKAVEGIKMEKATPEQWLKMIEKNGGLKAGEDKWMGLSDFLKASDKKTLTKQEVLDFINENMIQIEEQHYSNTEMGRESVRVLNEKYPGWEDAFSFDWDGYMEEPYADVYNNEAAVELYNNYHEDSVELDEDGEFEDMETEEKVREFGKELADIFYGSESVVRAIHGIREDYTTRGLTNNHEIALTVPTIESWGADDSVHFGDAGNGRAVAWIRFGDAMVYPSDIAQQIEAINEEIINYPGSVLDEEYKSIVARKTELRKQNKTNRVLVIDEIQSKRHQEGRDKGYKTKDYWPLRAAYLEKKTVYESLYDEMANKYGEEFTDAPNEDFAKRVLDTVDYERIMKAKAEFDAASAAYIPMRNAVPDAPFEKNWHELAMKRMLRYAAENGYDAIAWTKGDQQAERYGIGKVISGIHKDQTTEKGYQRFEINSYTPSAPRFIFTDNEGKIVDAMDNDGEEIQDYVGKNLSEVFGKDLAIKMLGAKENTLISHDEMRVGGEGMRGFYDKMLPAFMNKYGKKWGVKVEDIHLNLEGGLDMHSVPVTEEMKASVMEGQVMFRVRQENETPMEFEQSMLGDFKKEFNLPAPTTVVDVNDRDALAAALGYTPEEFTDEMYNDILAGYEQGGFAFYERDTKRIAIFAREELRNGIMVNNIVFHENTHYLEDENPEILELGEWLWQNSEPELRRKIKEVILESGMYDGEEAYEMLAAYTGYVMSQGKAGVAFAKTPSELQKHWELIFKAFGYEPREKEIRRRGTGDNSGRVGPFWNRRNAEAEMPTQRSDIQDLTAEERRIIGEYFPEFNKSEDVRYRMSDVNTNPTEAQKKAGNYKMGHIRLDGYNITIENPKGSVRRGTDSKGNAWENTLNNDYGYIRGTEGVDGDHIDAYLSDNPTEGNVFVVDQVNPETREFDEHKVMYGFSSAEEAREAYLANFNEGWNGLGTITEVSKDEFKKWIESSHRKTKPFSEYKSVNVIGSQSEGSDIETDDDIRLRATGTPTDEVVANGLQLTPAQTAEVAANIFAALPEESRKKITEGLNGNILGLKDAILQIPASLAMKENWNDEDKQMADIVAEEMTKIAGEMTRPFSAEEGLWLLYNNLNKGTDLISQASRALVQRNLGFDAETLAKQEQAKEDVRFRTVGDATSNAQASLYNRGAVNVWTRLKESYVDMMASVEELVKAIEKRTGKVAQGFENILLALNQQSSKGLAAMESYTQKFLNPMFDEIRRIMDDTKIKYEDIVRYVILKHGLERNKKLAQRDARAHYQEIYDDIIAKINSMDDRQKRTYLTNAQLKEADAKARLATLQAKDTTSLTDEELKAHKKELANARKEVKEAEEYRKRAEKIRNLSEQEAQDELDKIFEKIENGTDSVYKEMRENDYSGISSMFYDQLGVDRKKFSTEEQYQAALMEAKKDRYSSLADVEAAAEAEVASFEGKTDTKELWKRINAATKETLRQQYEANMISKDQYDSLRNMFEYYVPLRGFKDNTAEDMYTYYRKPNSTGYTKPILGAEGRKTEAESPFGWIAAMAGSAIASNVKNEAKLALYYFVSNRPENGIATISKTWFVDSGEVDERGKKIFKPAYPPFSEDLSSDAAKANYEAWQENMRELQKKGQAYEAGQRLNLGNAVVNISDANKPEHIVNVKVGGKDYTIIINGNPRAAQAINGDLNIEGTSQDYGALFGPVLRWMSSVNTSYNPEFWITNMMRDMAFTMMAVNIKEDPVYRRKFSKNYRKAFKVISLAAKNENGTIGDSYLEEQYKDFVKYGGVTGYTQIKDSETWEKEIENYLSSNDPESIKNGKVMRGMKSAFHAAHRFGESLEQVSRFAAFLTARETGKSINEAINDAKEITVNFNRKGSGKMITLEEAKYLTGKNGQPLTKPQQWMAVGLSSIAPLGRRFIMFFNAAIQGLNATYKLMKKNPKRFTGWALGYAAVGMMNAVLHAMLDDDDDYLDIPQYERRNSLMIGGNGAYFKWALPQEARAFYALGDLAVETVMGRNPHQNFLGEALKIGTEILPVNPSEGWKAFVPSVAIPVVELMINEDYKGAPIYNEQKWLSKEEKERTAKWSKAYQGTGWAYVKISQGLNFISGGDKHNAGLMNLHPEKLEHLVQSAFGGTIRTADKFITTIAAAVDPEEPVTIRQTPFLNRFLTINDERFKNVHVNDVFDYYKADAEHALTLEKQYTKDRDMDALTKLRSSDEYRWAKIYGKYKKPLKALKDKIKVADGTAEKKELMKQQDELKKRMIKEISEL